tara:strand:- start:1562 stop:1978 length:417 start_codon:yes stop_codon:yes gene_type:complete
MVTFRNNSGRRHSFRRNDRNYKNNGDRQKFGSNFSNNDNFQRKIPGRNNHNASKLIEKYNNLAREALSIGDKIMSENYFQHADHFSRILSDQENLRKSKFNVKTSSNNIEDLNNEKDKNNVQDEKINDKSDKFQSEAN